MNIARWYHYTVLARSVKSAICRSTHIARPLLQQWIPALSLIDHFIYSHGPPISITIHCCYEQYQDSKMNGANMGPTWVLSAPDGPHAGPINLVIRLGLFITEHILLSLVHLNVKNGNMRKAFNKCCQHDRVTHQAITGLMWNPSDTCVHHI